MKKWYILPLIIAALFLVFGCVSEPEKEKEKEPEPEVDRTAGPTGESAAPVEIIDHQYRGLKDVPEWVLMDQGELDELPDFKDYYVFKEFTSGRDLNAVKVWANDFNIASQIGQLVASRIKTQFGGAMVGDVDGAETYFEKIVKTVGEANVGGVRRHAEYWILRRYKNTDGSLKEDVYEYYILVKVPKSEVKKAIDRAFNQNEPASEEEVRARDHVRDIMEDEDW